MRVIMLDEPCAVGKVFEVFSKLGVSVKDTTIGDDNKIGNDVITMDLVIKIPSNLSIEKIIVELEKIHEVYDLVHAQ